MIFHVVAVTASESLRISFRLDLLDVVLAFEMHPYIFHNGILPNMAFTNPSFKQPFLILWIVVCPKNFRPFTLGRMNRLVGALGLEPTARLE